MKTKKAHPNRQAKPKPRVARERPKMPPIAEEMKHWSALLKTEVAGWPQVTTRPMFGMLSLFRRKKIFAALPVTRAIGTPHSVAFRFARFPKDLHRRAVEEQRISLGTHWHSFEIHSAEDLRDALWWLNQAHDRAK